MCNAKISAAARNKWLLKLRIKKATYVDLTEQ